MKKNILNLVLALIIPVAFFSCSQRDDMTDEYDGFVPMVEKSLEEIAEEVYLPVEDLVGMSEADLHNLRLDWILQQYCHVEGFDYFMDISQEEALKYGITKDYYDNYVKNWMSVTEQYNKWKESGIIVLVRDPQKECKLRMKTYNEKKLTTDSRASAETGGFFINTYLNKNSETVSFHILPSAGYVEFVCATEFIPKNGLTQYFNLEISVGTGGITIGGYVIKDNPWMFAVPVSVGDGMVRLTLTGGGCISCGWKQVPTTKYTVYRETP